MSYYDGDGDYIIYEDANGSRDSDVESGEYSYPEDEDDLAFVYQEDDEEGEEEDGEVHTEGDQEIDPDEDDNAEEDIGIVRAGSRSRNRDDRIGFLQDIVSRLAERRSEGSGGSEEDVEDNEDDHSERAFGRTLPGLLQELGRTGGAFSSTSRGNPRYAKLVDNVVNADDDPYMAMESLRELSEQLLMINPLIADRVLPARRLMDALIQVLSSPSLQSELELQLIACRCLYNYYEMNPEMIHVSVDKDIIYILKEKLTEISYIDLAEQVLETLEYISRVHGLNILRSGTLLSCVQYLDFFTIHAQKKALSIVANSCARAKESDYDSITEIFPVLKSVFVNNSNPILLKPVLITFYSVCGALNQKQLSNLFDLELVKRLFSLLTTGDMEIESLLKLLDVLSVLVSSNIDLSKHIILECDLIKTIHGIFNYYRKSPSASFSETLIYVPKELLLHVTTFLLLLLPTENGQVLTNDEPKSFTFRGEKERFEEIANELISCLIDIYSNTVETKIRYTVLVSLVRVLSILPVDSGTDFSSIINLISSGLITGSHISASELKSELGAIVAAQLSLVSLMTSSKPDFFIPKLRKEGIPEALAALKSHFQSQNIDATTEKGNEVNDNAAEKDKEETICENSETLPIFASESDFEDDEDNDENDSYRMEYDDMNIPDLVKPKKIRSKIFDHLTSFYISKNISMFSNSLLELFTGNEEEATHELSEINALVATMRDLDVHSNSEQQWTELWEDVKVTLFNDVSNISGFELLSTGIIDSMANIFNTERGESSIPRKTFLKVFESKLQPFVKILQNALSRTETFAILDAGTNANESASTSLIKQMRVRLVYDGADDDLENITLPENLRDVAIAVHCVASLKTLDDFLKHKIVQSEFLKSIVPSLNHSSERQPNPDNMAKEMEKVQFDFSLNGHHLDHSLTLYSIVFKQAILEDLPTSSIWNNVRTLKFKITKKRNAHNSLQVLYPDACFDGSDLKPVNGILTVLKGCQHPSVPESVYLNPKISAKLSRQLEEPLIVACGVLPNWVLDITRNYGFLFPFETRMNFLKNTSYGYGRLIQFWREKLEKSNSKNSNDNPLHQLGRLTRHKLRVSRDVLFISGLKILEKYGSSPNVLEIEYKDEEGTGLGPTLEFYSLMSKEFAQRSLDLWRSQEDNDDSSGDDYVSGLLFPRPHSANVREEEHARVLTLFENLGTFVARSMLDNRILDFRFNPVFFELMHRMCRNEPIDVEDFETCIELVSVIDQQLARSLSFLHSKKSEDSIQDLDLCFMLPGYDIELVEGGSKILVGPRNVDEYLIRVFDYMLRTGVEPQLNAFMKGFSKSFPYSSLLILRPTEIADLFGGVEEDWSVQTLYSSIQADHGYSMDCPTINDLIDILTNFSKQEKRLFLQFITGSPKLPLGGFKNLKPKFTVVLKHPEGDLSPDHYLPSVMTCANYLKLPKYTSKSVLHERLLQAMTEGAGAFLLS